MTILSVNVNKIAVLRNSRGDDYPDPVEAARVAIAAGCGGITVHPRPNQRHIRSDDVYRIAQMLSAYRPKTSTQAGDGTKLLSDKIVEYNIEGNPFAPADGTYPGYIELVRAVKPAQATLVPDGDTQITSDHGFDLKHEGARLKPLIAELKTLGCRVSLFMDADSIDIEQAAEIGADRIEIYTGPYAKAYSQGNYAHALDACVRTAKRARAVGLDVNAGHDLNQKNLGELRQAIPFLAEVSIGHALISEALYDGLTLTVQRYLAILMETDALLTGASSLGNQADSQSAKAG